MIGRWFSRCRPFMAFVVFATMDLIIALRDGAGMHRALAERSEELRRLLGLEEA